MIFIPSHKDLMDRDYLDSVKQDTIYILAPGPNGDGHWQDIPEGSFVICVNKAIELVHNGMIPECTVLWLVAELSALKTDWFIEHWESYKDILCIGKALVDPGGLEEHEYHKVFNYFGSMPCEGVMLRDDKLNSYGTVSCMATQLAYHLGAGRIPLIGVDMFGDQYYDKSYGFYKDLHDDKPWYCHINGFNEIISLIQDQGVKITTMSPSRLAIQYHTQEETT